MPPAMRGQLIDQARGTALRAARYALESMEHMNTVSATPIVELYNDWFRTSSSVAPMAGKTDRAIARPAVGYLAEPEGAAEAMPIKAWVSTHPDTFGLGSTPSRPDLGIALPSMGRYAESPGASLVFEPGSSKTIMLRKFLSASHYRDVSTAPMPSREAHEHLHLALRAILNQLDAASSMEKLAAADAEAMEETIREVFMFIMHHFL